MRYYVVILGLVFGSISTILHAVENEAELGQRLSDLMRQPKLSLDDRERIEKDALALLELNSSSDDKARVYTEIAFMYANIGENPPMQVVEYCEKALEYQKDITKKCQLYVYWGDSLYIETLRYEPEVKTIPRSSIISAYLKGLSLIVTNQTTYEKQELPTVGRYHYIGPPDNPEYQKVKERHTAQLADRARVKVQNTLIEFRRLLIEKCASLYSQEPSRMEEMISLSREIVRNDGITNELIAALKKTKESRQ